MLRKPINKTPIENEKYYTSRRDSTRKFLFTVDDDDKKQNVDDTPEGEGESGGSETCFVHARDIARIVLERSCNTTYQFTFG